MALIDQEKIDDICLLWCGIDFDFDKYFNEWYFKQHGNEEHEKCDWDFAHDDTRATLKQIEDQFDPSNRLTSEAYTKLRSSGWELCRWGMLYPLDMNLGGFSQWLVLARRLKGEANAGKDMDALKEGWQRMGGLYLKIKDLHLQSKEKDIEGDWDFLATYNKENRKRWKISPKAS